MIDSLTFFSRLSSLFFCLLNIENWKHTNSPSFRALKYFTNLKQISSPLQHQEKKKNRIFFFHFFFIILVR